MKQLIIAVKMTVVLTLVTGIAYPILVTGLAKALFPRQANGSMVQSGGRTAGSALIGQNFTKPEYFHGRPSASNYDGLASGGSNYGPTNQKLIGRVQADLKAFRAGNPTFSGPVPADLLTASGSGLDPDLSPESAEAQAARVAAARGMDVAAVSKLIEANTEGRQLGFFGEPRVNVLNLNLALDRAAPVRK